YVHRIGRTGRAGREGEAILFVTPREKRLLNSLERSTKQKIAQMEMPSTEVVNNQRIARFKQQITDTLAKEDSKFFVNILEQYEQEHDVPAIEIAGALAQLLQGDEPLLLEEKKKPQRRDAGTGAATSSVGMERFRVEVGRQHRVKPGHIVGAIANETGLANKYIGRIAIYDDYSTVDLPVGIPKETFSLLKKVQVLGHPMNISSMGKTRDDGNWREGKPKRQRSGRSGPPFKKRRRKDGKNVGRSGNVKVGRPVKASR
ncbi:MAG: DbpA RNA binding domain-containing protein, partial [Cyanobacteria bacterium J06649_4]